MARAPCACWCAARPRHDTCRTAADHRTCRADPDRARLRLAGDRSRPTIPTRSARRWLPSSRTHASPRPASFFAGGPKARSDAARAARTACAQRRPRSTSSLCRRARHSARSRSTPPAARFAWRASRACPTGALGDDPERPLLRFTEDACVQCGLCKATCPEKVITLKPQLDFRAVTAHCPACSRKKSRSTAFAAASRSASRAPSSA